MSRLSLGTKGIPFALFMVLASSAVVSAGPPAPVAVRYAEGVARGFPVLRSVEGAQLAEGELTQVARGDRVDSRLVFRFADGSLYDERVVFSQDKVFTLLSYAITQHGPSFPEALDAAIDRETGRYRVRYKADEDAAEEIISGRFELPSDAYNGMLGLLLKNLPWGTSETVQIVAFTPKPRLVKLLLQPIGEDPIRLGDRLLPATKYLIRPQLGMLASLLITDIVPAQCWVLGGDAPAFLKFQGPLYFMGPSWRIELN